MSRLHVFADEAGCLTFAKNNGVSTYFILCTVMMNDCAVGTAITELRRQLAWEGVEIGEYFHASSDKQVVRDAVYSTILPHDFTIQFTSMEKSKAQPQVTKSKERFYQYGWFYHLKHGVAKKIPSGTETLVTAASIGQKKEKATFLSCVEDAASQTLYQGEWKTGFCPAASDPCVQVADYCAWAIQRKLERNDPRSYDLIKDKINHSYDLFAKGDIHYY